MRGEREGDSESIAAGRLKDRNKMERRLKTIQASIRK
jgi:hypothetical protein